MVLSFGGISLDEREKRLCVLILKGHLSALCYQKVIFTERDHRGKAVSQRHSVEPVEEIQRRFLILE